MLLDPHGELAIEGTARCSELVGMPTAKDGIADHSSIISPEVPSVERIDRSKFLNSRLSSDHFDLGSSPRGAGSSAHHMTAPMADAVSTQA
jgi:hypothetical protein